MHKSDLSSADDIIDGVTKRKRKCPNRGESLSPNILIKSKKLKVNRSKCTKIFSDSCPPRYHGKMLSLLCLICSFMLIICIYLNTF